MDNINNKIINTIISSIECKKLLIKDEELIITLEKIAQEIIKAFNENKKVLFCGNGGSAADAQHLSAELSGRFYKDRPGLNSEALHVNTSYVTAVANDYSFDEIFSRAVIAKCNKGDVLISLSTSGNSKNIINAGKVANEIGVVTVGFTGRGGGSLKDSCNFCICVPSNDVARIQEVHIMLGHILCEIVEDEIFN